MATTKRSIPSWVKRFHLPEADRTIVLAPVVGVVVGIAAILFHLLCLIVTQYTLVNLGGYEQGGATNESGFDKVFPQWVHHRVEHLSLWYLILIPAVGGLLCGIIIHVFAPDAQGHGTDSAIDSYHHKRGKLSSLVSIVKMFTSAITLGTGGSGGREGPMTQIGAGFGSYIATKFNLTDQERRVLMCAGLGAGLGAIFQAPLAGGIFAVEVLYMDPDFETEALIPSLIATAIAYTTFCLLFGFNTLFEVPAMTFDRPILLVPLTVMAIVLSIAAWSFAKMFYGVHHFINEMKLNKILKTAIGAMLTGALAVGCFLALKPLGEQAQHNSLSVMSYGYGFLQQVLNNNLTTDIKASIIVLLVVGIGKMVTTTLTIGSGGSGGLFGPCMVIGGTLGAVIGLLFHYFTPGIVHQKDVAIFAILGMASFFAAGACTPVSTIIIVTELTGSYKLLLPSMWVCALSYFLARGWTLYIAQLPNRLTSPAHRGDFIVDILEGLTIRDTMSQVNRDFVTTPLDMPLSEMMSLITDTRQICFPVTTAEGLYYGIFSLNDIRQFLYDSPLAELAVAQDLAATKEPLMLQMSLSNAMSLFAQGAFAELPVVDEEDPTHVIGLLRRHDLIATYNKQLLQLRKDGD